MNTSIKKIKGLISFKGKKINIAPMVKEPTIMVEIEELFKFRKDLMTSLGVKIDGAHYYSYETIFNSIEVKIKIASRKNNNSSLKGKIYTTEPLVEIAKLFEDSFLSFLQVDLSWTNGMQKPVTYSLMGAEKELDLYNNVGGVIGKKINNLEEKEKILNYINMPKLIEYLSGEIAMKKMAIKDTGLGKTFSSLGGSKLKP